MVIVSGSSPPVKVDPDAEMLGESLERVMLFPASPSVTAVKLIVFPDATAVAIPHVPTEPEFIALAILAAITAGSAEDPSNSSTAGAPTTEVRTTPPISVSPPAKTGAPTTVKEAVETDRTSGVPAIVMDREARVEGTDGPVISVDGSSHLMSASEEWKADIAVGLAGGQGKVPEVGSHPVLIQISPASFCN